MLLTAILTILAISSGVMTGVALYLVYAVRRGQVELLPEDRKKAERTRSFRHARRKLLKPKLHSDGSIAQIEQQLDEASRNSRARPSNLFR